MICDRCEEDIKEKEEREYHGRILCEDCYMDCLSPVKACDPWAVFAAKSFSRKDGAAVELTETQSAILEILKETGGVTPEVISERLRINPADLEREVATLRHMEKLRGELREGKKILRLW